MRLAQVLLALLLAAAATATPAVALDLSGPFTEGGLVVGEVAPGTDVRLDGAAVPVGADGRFLIGFPRDAPATMPLSVVYPDGRTETRRLEIASREYDVQRIDGLPERQVSPYSAEDLARIRREKELSDAAKTEAERTLESLFASGFQWPAEGRVTGVYGSQRILNGKPKRPHYGTDVAAPPGTPVVAMADGIVRIAHPGMFFNGATVMLDHGHGLVSHYIHLSLVEVELGQRVEKGQRIGLVGASGRATGPHLHWAITLRGVPLDPALLVSPRP